MQIKKKKKSYWWISCLICLLTLTQLGCASKKVMSQEIRIGALKGPTTMGLLFLMEDAKQGNTQNDYQFEMATGADELLPKMVQGQLDIALIPANVASILYQKTEGGICVIDINTLGVLSMVSNDSNIHTVQQLEGKTITLTGKGTTPDYVLQYILEENNIKNYTLEYKSEATEVVATLQEKPGTIGLLPQPFATAACMQNDTLSVIFSMNEEWNALQGPDGSGMVTGVTVARKEFLEQQEEAVQAFLEEHKKSALAVTENAEQGASLCVEAGIVAKEPIAKAAIPNCNITCITGEEMKQTLEGYLQVLYEKSPESVGGMLPQEDFYYITNKVHD